MNAWDCLAGMLLVEEAGGTVLKANPKTVIGKGTQVITGGKHIFPRLQLLCQSSFGPPR
jgi:myo-inositol-1(or 4)-monophosphatase